MSWQLSFPLEPADESPRCDFASIPGQESAKRILEIAAAGDHAIQIRGAGPCDDLIDAFMGIGGTCWQLERSPEMYLDVPPTPQAEIERPAPSEPSATIRARVEQARARLDQVSDQLGGASRTFWREVEECGSFDESQLSAALRIARTIAAQDGCKSLLRIHLAEAVTYTMRPPAE